MILWHVRHRTFHSHDATSLIAILLCPCGKPTNPCQDCSCSHTTQEGKHATTALKMVIGCWLVDVLKTSLTWKTPWRRHWLLSINESVLAALVGDPGVNSEANWACGRPGSRWCPPMMPAPHRTLSTQKMRRLAKSPGVRIRFLAVLATIFFYSIIRLIYVLKLFMFIWGPKNNRCDLPR